MDAHAGKRMARYKECDYKQTKLVPVSFSNQILPVTFEYTLNHLIDHELDLVAFDDVYRNDDTGPPPTIPRFS